MLHAHLMSTYTTLTLRGFYPKACLTLAANLYARFLSFQIRDLGLSKLDRFALPRFTSGPVSGSPQASLPCRRSQRVCFPCYLHARWIYHTRFAFRTSRSITCSSFTLLLARWLSALSTALTSLCSLGRIFIFFPRHLKQRISLLDLISHLTKELGTDTLSQYSVLSRFQ